MAQNNKEEHKVGVLHNLLSRLKSQPLIEMQIKFAIFCAHVRVPFKRYYDQLYGQVTTSKPEVTQPTYQDNHRLSFADVNEWDWRGLPDEWPLARLWSLCSTAWMCVVIMKTLFSEQLFALAHLLTGWPGHCVIMGRFVLHPSLAALAAFLFAAFHLIWRHRQQLKTRVYMLGIFSFLLQTDRDLNRFYALTKTTESGATYLPDNQQLHVHFFRHIMCFKVRLESGRVVYKLRPNRTWQSRKTLIDSFLATSVAVTCGFLSLAIPISSTITVLLLSDLRFVQTYPGCSPHLDYLYTSGQLESVWSWTFTNYRLISFVFDFFENLLVWMDSGLALSFVLALTYLMNCDILLYWHHLHEHIRIVLIRVRTHYLKNHLANSSIHNERSATYLSAAHERSPATGSCGCRSRAWVRYERDRRQLEAELNELHFEFIDFFEQVKEADKIVGDILTMAILIWLICLEFTNYYYLIRPHSDFPAIARWMQFLGLSVITLVTHYILQLHRCCSRSYRLICSLIAFDQSITARKFKFITLMEFFNKRQATTYTLFRRVPYKATTYLTIIGWSFSLVVVSYGLFDRARPLPTTTTTTTSAPSNVPILGGPKYFAFSSSLQ